MSKIGYETKRSNAKKCFFEYLFCFANGEKVLRVLNDAPEKDHFILFVVNEKGYFGVRRYSKCNKILETELLASVYVNCILYSFGENFVMPLNCRLKFEMLLKPDSKHTSAME